MRAPLRIANLCQPHEIPYNDRHVHYGGEFLRSRTSEGTEQNAAAVVEESESAGDSKD
jgi:hypothetical protein